eukprot:NODE_9948_length_455_cov_28.115764_g8849_i0.p3 GENE.NODE_9948_length_455_cov_28.115764_g8849_i0~~NODE_9948_length_455_cov_28.115764_g8849_i0.p3  ORF type:complete len:78 (-),score=1.75 NODE_9948_length_455_cov_28.115764_g8849_i0:38-271(-)
MWSCRGVPQGPPQGKALEDPGMEGWPEVGQLSDFMPEKGLPQGPSGPGIPKGLRDQVRRARCLGGGTLCEGYPQDPL